MLIFSTGVKIQLRVLDRNANAAVDGETFLKKSPAVDLAPRISLRALQNIELHSMYNHNIV